MDDKLEKRLRRELKIHAKGLGIPEGAAESFIGPVITATKSALSKKSVITEKDLNLILSRELKKYNADFAYVYKNRDKII